MNESIMLCDQIIEELLGKVANVSLRKKLLTLRELIKEEAKAVEDELCFLDCLRGCGVDNWEGYSDAIDMYREENENKNS